MIGKIGNKWEWVFGARLLRALDTKNLNFILESMVGNEHSQKCGRWIGGCGEAENCYEAI